MHSFNLVVDASTTKNASVMRDTLLPDMDSPHQKRSSATLTQNGKTLRLEVKAEDATALRAAFHYYASGLQLSQALLKEFSIFKE